MNRGALQKTLNACGPLVINKNTEIWPRSLHVAPTGGRGTCLRNLDIETRAAKVWDLVQSDHQNLTTQTRQLSRLVR